MPRLKKSLRPDMLVSVPRGLGCCVREILACSSLLLDTIGGLTQSVGAEHGAVAMSCKRLNALPKVQDSYSCGDPSMSTS
jgi:hypothetical protein